MPDIDRPLAELRAAVGELVAAADRAGASWTRPRAPGKWSPSQVVEHVARIMEESANVADGRPSKFPTMHFLLRPVIRILFFKRTLWRNDFPKMKAIDAFVPIAGPGTPADGRDRLQGALTLFDQACRARTASGQKVASTMFGAVPVADFARFQELHVRHHIMQMPGAA
ncbi:MAG TPA: DUF1569 domain-containing protein [Gemmatimonadaceae bacterium]|nr:DUF1569 domain-containing protein [Gemmatimonadaceae bacterium]